MAKPRVCDKITRSTSNLFWRREELNPSDHKVSRLRVKYIPKISSQLCSAVLTQIMSVTDS